MTSSRKEHLVQTAVELFKRQGFHATGIDQIIATAGVAKMTLYNHFRSKEELILAALRRWDEESRRWLIREIERRAETPHGRLLALFDVLEVWFDQNEFTGCLFINATAEYGRIDDPIHRAAAEHKRLFRGYVLDLARQTGAADADDLADQILLLMEGSIVTAHVSGRSESARLARRTAELLLESQTPFVRSA